MNVILNVTLHHVILKMIDYTSFHVLGHTQKYITHMEKSPSEGLL